MEKVRRFITDNNKHIIFIAALLGVFFCFRYLLPLFSPFVIAFLLAWMLRPAAIFLKKRLRLPYAIGGLISMAVLLSIIGTGLFFLLRIFVEQLLLFLNRLPDYVELMSEQIDGMCCFCDSLFGMEEGTSGIAFDNSIYSLMEYVQSDLLPKLTSQTLLFAIGLIEFFGIIFIVLIATLLIIKEMGAYHEGKQSIGFYPLFQKVSSKLSETGIAYLRTQGIIMLILAAVYTIGLFIIKNDYALLIGIGIAVFDAFPVLGSGTILIPWAIIRFLSGDFLEGSVLLAVFIIGQVIREVIEPRLLGNKIGLRPIYTLIAMVIGFRLFGLIGFLLGPLGLVIAKTVRDYAA